ncbi:choice-of-anchor B domain-containing protein [Muriicola jejuensis]|uniref:Choice-of-anchor B family protein n=1 Tax=Muriicola jejuensis TaxID=504488 RepID=A0A6P0UF13_9FLAO|nr:choice-of-anchor B family protein [Muriicola jejuensis]NER09843.1 choice-of-anchor B family protein [Muriicola jejuensis]SMP05262.1 choice-of-anchor B domain-containing protein [Muriicola jejuensis]
MKRSLPFFILLIFLACSKNDDTGPDLVVIDPVDDPPVEDPVDPGTNFIPCENGFAGAYPCQGYDLLGRLSLSSLGATAGNDIWGWTDTASSREFALIGLNNGTAFVEITDTENLVYLGKLLTATTSSAWRDIKVYGDYAFIGSEAAGHGMQVFDLRKLLSVSNTPATFSADTRYTGFGNSHNLVINEETGYAYAVGTDRGDLYNGGAHFIDIQDPMNPTAAGGYGDNGYSHDAQVVLYQGPDPDYTGREIFIGANENAVVVVDVTDKQNPAGISTIQYSNIGYTHQGWFTEDQRYFILGDELDEINFGFNSRTLVFDLLDLDAPVLLTTYTGTTSAIDHNGYVKGNTYYLANYTAGVRMLDITNLPGGTITETGYFDSFPSGNSASFNGVWSVYPYFQSGKIILNDINSGFFVIAPSN